jgi:alpha-ketoglutarate-dependent taurine dioxygenase
MGAISIRRLGDKVGAEIVDLDPEQLLGDASLPAECLEALDAYGVLLFRELNLDDTLQVAFAKRLGEVVAVPSHPIPEITVISLDPENPLAEYLRGAFEWHIDGSMDDIPSKASLLSAHVLATSGGDTEFASTYAAFDDLSDDERELFGPLQVVHTFEATQRCIFPDPTDEQLADWHTRAPKVHPLVWKHQSGRSSLVLGSTASHIEGMDPDEGRALLADLLGRATAPEKIYRHVWSVGDLVIWDNRGVMHRACHYDSTSQREMHRTTLVGDEVIG